MGRLSSGGTNFGDAEFSQSKVASTSGLCLRTPTPRRREFHHELAGSVVVVSDRPILDPGTLSLERAGHPRHHHIRQSAFLQKIQEASVKETAVGPRPCSPLCSQPCKMNCASASTASKG